MKAHAEVIALGGCDPDLSGIYDRSCQHKKKDQSPSCSQGTETTTKQPTMCHTIFTAYTGCQHTPIATTSQCGLAKNLYDEQTTKCAEDMFCPRLDWRSYETQWTGGRCLVCAAGGMPLLGSVGHDSLDHDYVQMSEERLREWNRRCINEGF
jgi:hypothetical protein